MKRDPNYEKPRVDVIVFEMEEAIASSLDHGPSLSCGEEIFGLGGDKQ